MVYPHYYPSNYAPKNSSNNNNFAYQQNSQMVLNSRYASPGFNPPSTQVMSILGGVRQNIQNSSTQGGNWLNRIFNRGGSPQLITDDFGAW